MHAHFLRRQHNMGAGGMPHCPSHLAAAGLGPAKLYLLAYNGVLFFGFAQAESCLQFSTIACLNIRYCSAALQRK